MDEQSKKRFVWGVLLAWLPWLPSLVGIGYVLIGMVSAKATGLAAVAGGLTEMFVTWGIASVLIAQVAAIVFLSRSFTSGSLVRRSVSVFSICASSLMLFIVGLFLWFTWVQRHHAP